MELYLIRHAEAQPLSSSDAKDDADRPLTDAGHAQAQALAAALQKHSVHLDQVVSSPLLRARQTADDLIQAWKTPLPELLLCEALEPEMAKARKVTKFLLKLSANSVALVGHMPCLGEYAAWVLGSKKVEIALAKSGVARIDCEGVPDKGAGTLAWLITPEWCKV
jgi:phosphohistidine phosphatase